jgi:TolA-binding protein
MKRTAHDTQAACDETQRWLLVTHGHDNESRASDGLAPGLRVRAERHLGRCPSCQRSQAELAQIHADMQVVSPPLDDVRRARMLAQMSPALDELAARLGARSEARGRRGDLWSGLRGLWQDHGRALLLGGAAMGLAAALFTTFDPSGRHLSRSGQRGFASDAPSARDLGPVRLEPFRVSGVGSESARGFLGGRFDHLDVPAGTTLRARLGRRARVSLIGPAQLEVTSTSADVIEVKLRQGKLVADYDHGAGGRLRVRSPDGVTEVIGTLFSVDVDGGHSRIAVARGRVSVEGTGGSAQVLGAGQAWDIGKPAPQALPAPALELLEAHERESATAALGGEPEVGARAQDERPMAGEISARGPSVPSKPASAAWREPAPEPPRVPHRSAAESARAATIALAEHGHGAARVRSHPSTPVAAKAAQSARDLALVTPAPAAATAVGALPPAPLVPPAIVPPPPAPAVVLTPAPVVPPAPAEGPSDVRAAAEAPTVPLPTTEALYRAAEADMRRRDWESARQRLGQVVASGSHDPIADVARYELAQLALRKGDRVRAQRYIEELLASDREPALREPAGFLACEMKAEARDVAGARACFEAFRTQHPESAHDRGALGWLVRLGSAAESCAGGRRWFDEYLRRYPAGPDAATAADRKARCRQ